MKQSYQFNQTYEFLNGILAPLNSAALLTSEGETIYLKYQTLDDIGTLPQAVQTSHQYLQLDDGDIVLINDPYSGGSLLSNMNLVIGLQPGKGGAGKRSPILLLCQRFSFKPKINLSPSVEDEGLRIPPTPLRKNGVINQELLQIIAQHPSAPPRFVEVIDSAIEQLLKVRERFQIFSERMGLEWSKNYLRRYFQHSSRRMRNVLQELSVGESQYDMAIDEKTRIKLRVEATDGKVVFDFSGTDNSNYLFLTSAATYGACAGALVALFDNPIPLNSGVFSCLEVHAPAGTLVNAKYPNPVFLGMTDGTSIIANLVLKTIGQIDKRRRQALAGCSQCSFQLEFNSNQHFFETLATGTPASDGRKGIDGLHLWKRSHLNPSLEEIEKRFPLTLKSYAFRANSGGSGAYAGGDGVTKSVRIEKPAHLKWVITEPLHKPEGSQGGKSASGPEIIVTTTDNERQKLSHRGEMDLTPGTIITIHSAGGGGYGEATS